MLLYNTTILLIKSGSYIKNEEITDNNQGDFKTY